MSALFRIIYAAHANGTHHKLALDALNHMQRPDAEAWRRVILKHVDKYLEGSKAPDNVFKDFKNHVLHVGENYWGGAPEKVEEWYGTTVTALRSGAWETAAYSAGVLSHYYTDPIMPFHTGQTEAESAIHRATEWSINRSYNALRKLGEERFATLDVKSRDGADWLKEMTCDGAEASHRYYEKLIAHYDIHKGAVVPEDGLDSIARPIVAELLMYAAEGFGMLLDRAFAESGVTAPEVTLTVETVVAALNMPKKWIEKRLSNAEDRALVQAMYDELKATGKVEATLPEDDRVIRDLHAAEVLAPKLADRTMKRAARLPGKYDIQTVAKASRFELALAESANVIAKTASAAKPTPVAGQQAASASPAKAVPPPIPASPKVESAAAETPAKILNDAIPNAPPAPVIRDQPALALPPKGTFSKPRSEAAEPATSVTAQDKTPSVPEAIVQPVTTATSAPIALPERTEAQAPRSYLSLPAPLEDAPSIGPKMAERFAALGINTVGDFLGHDPHDIAELLDDKRIDSETITDWQDQAQLVIDVPGLRGGGAQLLVGSGYRTREALADCDPVDLSADVLKFATSSEGKRILREGNPPDLEKIKAWVSSAREALAA
jgi:predicted flap endonuclease-1-like 5' DNA nuclease